jgi:hypothetical protein
MVLILGNTRLRTTKSPGFGIRQTGVQNPFLSLSEKGSTTFLVCSSVFSSIKVRIIFAP